MPCPHFYSCRSLAVAFTIYMDKVLYLLLLAPAFVSALTIHEFAHAWAAYKLGDDTAQRQGRLTLDPLAHLDPIGTLLIVVAIFTGAPLIGWAKPVPFQMRNLGNPRRDAMLIALAGPVSNILQAIFWLIMLVIFRFVTQSSGVVFNGGEVVDMIRINPDLNSIPSIIGTILITAFSMNIMLAVFNMIPLPPLDGHYVLEHYAPPAISDLFDQIRPYSFMILLGLLWFGVLGAILAPFRDLVFQIIAVVFGMTYTR